MSLCIEMYVGFSIQLHYEIFYITIIKYSSFRIIKIILGPAFLYKEHNSIQNQNKKANGMVQKQVCQERNWPFLLTHTLKQEVFYLLIHRIII